MRVAGGVQWYLVMSVCAQCSGLVTDFELERVLEVSSVHREAGLVVGKEVILCHICRPYYLGLVQDLVYL